MDRPVPSRPGGPDPAASPSTPLSLTAEHDWAAAAGVLMPALRPPGTRGRQAAGIAFPVAAAGDTQPLVDDGPCGLVVVYTIPGSGYDIVVSGDHLASWSVPVAEVRAAALGNLERWSAAAPWIDETDAGRRIRSSASGGPDAARILLAGVRADLGATLGGGGGRVLVGLPEPNLLLAGAAAPGDAAFEGLFAEFVAACAADADEPIDARTFELRDGILAVATRPRSIDPA